MQSSKLVVANRSCAELGTAQPQLFVHVLINFPVFFSFLFVLVVVLVLVAEVKFGNKIL